MKYTIEVIGFLFYQYFVLAWFFLQEKKPIRYKTLASTIIHCDNACANNEFTNS